MPPTAPATWTDRLRRTLACYEEPLLRQVAARLFKPRSQWPAEELIERSINTFQNPAVLDRRLADLDPAARQLLALIGHSRQPRWQVGNLVEMLVALGHADGLDAVVHLLQAGLLYPEIAPAAGVNGSGPRLRHFEQWLAQTEGRRLTVFAHPLVTGRLSPQDLALPECPGQGALQGQSTAAARNPGVATQEADGLEWPLKLAVLWQQVASAPLRRTQQGGFFKRDLERLKSEPLLNAAPADALVALPDPGLLAVELALGEGLVYETDGELRAGTYPACWDEGLPAAVASLWAALLHVESWNARDGWRPGAGLGNPYPSAYLLALLLLTGLPVEGWASPAALERWMLTHHPYWHGGGTGPTRSCGLEAFLLGLAYQLRLLLVARDAGDGWLVRLSPLGRWLLSGGAAPELPAFPQTLLVQPNLEILAYRQGLTPDLVARLGRFATWKGLGPACTLQLQPESVYRALESGETFETILQALQRHGMKPVADPVVNSLRTWADKRERIQVYAAAALFEFNSPEELSDALARGLPAVRLSDRLAVVAREGDIDYRHFRLIGTRDYALPPERCVAVEADGVTLGIDLARSDLLLETEVGRFAEPVQRGGVSGRRFYRLTPASVAAARANGLSLQTLEGWFLQRTGQPLSAAGRLLLVGGQVGPLALRRLLVLYAPSAEVADGLQQWPETRALIEARLGPTALVVSEEAAAALRKRLEGLGIELGAAGE
jgi:hypothetical protein